MRQIYEPQSNKFDIQSTFDSTTKRRLTNHADIGELVTNYRELVCYLMVLSKDRR